MKYSLNLENTKMAEARWRTKITTQEMGNLEFIDSDVYIEFNDTKWHIQNGGKILLFKKRLI